MTKTIYFAPTAEQIDLKIEKNFMATGESLQRVQGSWEEDPNA